MQGLDRILFAILLTAMPGAACPSLSHALRDSKGTISSNVATDDSRYRASRHVVADRSPQIVGRVLSTRPIFKTEPGSPERIPAITSGSGITRAGWWLFAAQDDSSLVAAKGTDGSLETIRVFPSVDGSDRFSEAHGNKALKPDIEAAVTVQVPASLAAVFKVNPTPRHSSYEAVLLVGSGSKPILRDRIALIFPAVTLQESEVVAVHALQFYEALRREPALAGLGGEINIEGVTHVQNGQYLRFYNRGNGRKGSVVGSVDIPLERFIAYLTRASAEPDASFSIPFKNQRTYDLGRASSGEVIGITDAITLPLLEGAPRGMTGEIYIMSAIAEHTATAVNDGYTSDSSICLEFPDGKMYLAPLNGIEGAERLKIEGLSVVSAKWIGRPASLQLHLLAVIDADAKDPNTPSMFASVEITFQPLKS